MPTGSEMAEALKRMSRETNTPTNRATIRAAASALVSQEKRVAELERQLEGTDKALKRLAELERRLAQVIAASAEGDDLALVAKGGETLRVKAFLARLASPYFAGLLDSGFDEAGTKRIKFDDVDIVVLRFVVAGIHAGEAGADLVAPPSPHEATVIEQIIGFSARLLMPWLAQAAVRRALESTDAAMLVDLLLAAEGYVQREREGGVILVDVPSVWEELSEATVQRLAALLRSLVEAGKVEAFFRLPLELVQRILALVNDAAWCEFDEWHDLAVLAEGAVPVKSPPTKEGVYLQSFKHLDGCVGAHIRFVEGAAASAPVVIGSKAYTGTDFVVQALSSSKHTASLRRAGSCILSNAEWVGGILLPDEICKSFVHGDSYKFRFRARHSKLHTQCHVLLKCVESHLPQEAQARPLIVSALEFLRSNTDLKDLHAMLVEYMAGVLCRISGQDLRQLSCCDMEAIITHPSLFTPCEFSVLKAVLHWAQSPERLTPSVGAEVRVRDDSKHEQWRGAECRVVKKIDIPTQSDPAACLWEIERAADPAAGTLAGLRAWDLLCPGHIGLEKLLEHVRFPFIKREQLKTQLSQKEISLAGKSPAFKRGWTEAFEVQRGMRKAEELGERAQKRAKTCRSDKIPEVTLSSEWLAMAALRS